MVNRERFFSYGKRKEEVLEMTRNRFCKLIMAQGIQRNTAAEMAKEVGKTGSYERLYFWFIIRKRKLPSTLDTWEWLRKELLSVCEWLKKAIIQAVESILENAELFLTKSPSNIFKGGA